MFLHFNKSFVFLSLGQFSDNIVYIVLAVAVLALVLMFIHRWKESSKMDVGQEAKIYMNTDEFLYFDESNNLVKHV